MSWSPAAETKRLGGPLRGAAGLIEGYASLFGVVDLAGDLVEPGAFTKSLARRGTAQIRCLFQHDPAEPIGAWEFLREDSRGLFARGRLNLAVGRAREVAALLEQGAIDGLSIGFKTVRARRDRRAGVRRLSEIDLWEISVVTFPMLPDARVIAPGAARSVRCRPRPSEARGSGPRLSGARTRDDAASLGPLPSRLRREPGTTAKHP
jgi:uncharacterized protein